MVLSIVEMKLVWKIHSVPINIKMTFKMIAKKKNNIIFELEALNE